MRPVFPDGVSEEGHSNCSRNTGCIMFILNVVQPFFSCNRYCDMEMSASLKSTGRERRAKKE
ncbi:MAG: hypothetical protein UC961_09395 [Emergencia sp.]|nr:hypothetical protein [Emergencia sp.]